MASFRVRSCSLLARLELERVQVRAEVEATFGFVVPAGTRTCSHRPDRIASFPIATKSEGLSPTNLPGSSEFSNALQVLLCALRSCAFGLRFHGKPGRCARAKASPSALAAPIWAAQRSNSVGLFASASNAVAICSDVGTRVYGRQKHVSSYSHLGSLMPCSRLRYLSRTWNLVVPIS